MTLVGISDGTSNTLMVGEDLPELNQHCGWTRANYANGTCAIPLNNALLPGQPSFKQPGQWWNLYSFRSRHTGGGNFGMADGTVRFVRDSIDLTVYRAASTIRGNETVSLD